MGSNGDSPGAIRGRFSANNSFRITLTNEQRGAVSIMSKSGIEWVRTFED